jgi:D-3-phosphoglycerate dehydrogenase / 2-oxoglutarate reductase
MRTHPEDEAGPSTPIRVVVADKVSASGLAPLTGDDRFEIIEAAGWPEERLREALAGARGLIVRSATKVTSGVLEAAPSLEVVGRAGVGVDNIDMDAATARGVAVLNAPAGNTVSAAELTMALMLAAVRKVAGADRSVRRGEWNRKDYGGNELRWKTLGLVGAGRIGSEVARRARAFKMKVVAYDPYLPEERAQELGIKLVSLETLLESADVVSLHTPLTDTTRGIIGTNEMARMKPTAFLVNVGRGGLTDEAALARALQEGSLAGAALDVFETEPLPDDSPLRSAPNLVLTPHLGASTEEAQERVAEEIAHAIRAALLEGDLSRALNAPAIGGEALRRLRPLLDLGGRMGRLAFVLADGGIREVEIRYAGSEAERKGVEPLKPLAAAVMAGVLAEIVGRDGVNFVNALHLAKTRGIRVATSTDPRHRDYAEYLEASVESEGSTVRVAGAVLGERFLRVVSIDGMDIDLPPHGTMIVLRNQDVPGVIGRVGTALGEREMNIADYRQSRAAPGGKAMAVVTVDGEVGADTLAALREIPEVRDARMVRLD